MSLVISPKLASINYGTNFKNNSVGAVDVIEKKDAKPKSTNKTAKNGIAVLSALALAGAITYVAIRKPGTKVDSVKNELEKELKECFEFFDIKKLPEHIEFKEAKTAEEAENFAKDVLGVFYRNTHSRFRPDVSLEDMNIINKAMVDVSNAQKGMVYLPKIIGCYDRHHYDKDVIKDTIASVEHKVGTQYQTMVLFDMYCDMQNLQEIIKERTEAIKKSEFFETVFEGEIKALLEKFNNNSCSRAEMWKIYCSIRPYFDVKRKPLKLYEVIAKKYPDLKINLELISQKSKEEQIKELEKILKNLKKEGRPLKIVFDECGNECYVTYHELGHLQHMLFDYKAMNSSDRNVFSDKHSDMGFSKEKIEEMRQKGELHSWHQPIVDFFNPENQETALEVSEYAATKPGEFVAEVFSGKMQGYKFSDRVEALYKKYNGPEIINPPAQKEPILHFE